MAFLLAALGLLLAIEGITFAAFPGAAKRAAALIVDAPDTTLRAVGIVAAIAGVVIVWLVRGQGI